MVLVKRQRANRPSEPAEAKAGRDMRYVATGRVHPERADVTMLPPIVWTGSDGFKITLSCESSQLTVVLDDPPVDGFVAAFLEAKQWARAAVSALSFALGTGYTVELIQLVEESGAVRVFGVRTEELMFAPHEPIFSASIRLSAQDVFFRMALVDYARAMADETECAAYCYRAIEAIKSAFGPGDDKELWERMHSSLGTSRDEVETAVKAFADPIRHGNWSRFPPTGRRQRTEMLQVTRNVLEKYLALRKPSA
jgi:hypothetical protein